MILPYNQKLFQFHIKYIFIYKLYNIFGIRGHIKIRCLWSFWVNYKINF